MIGIRDGILGCAVMMLMMSASSGSGAQVKEKILYSFMGGDDGADPLAGLVEDVHGNLYGATYYGGGRGCHRQGCGTIFKLTPSGTETVLHSFKDGSDGAVPYAALILDAQHNLYGTTSVGGDIDCYDKGCGTVFELSPAGSETALHSFMGSDGSFPTSTLIADAEGDLYGTASGGGTTGAGTVVEIAPNGATTVLHSFTGGNDGGYPSAGLIADPSGNLYGTAYTGGASGLGAVFEVTQKGAESVLYSFCHKANCVDGEYPLGGLSADAQGNLYGTTLEGGSSGYGTVFKLTRKGKETVLYSFLASGTDGAFPYAGLIADSRGNLYGTTHLGGTSQGGGYGTVFKVTPEGRETVLHFFAAGSDGAYPDAPLIADSRGNLYGTTFAGGAHGLGTVFEIEK